ncbi:MAG: malate dehydrogenase [Nitrospiraceae bacterium]|nr:MAG: malate dehydrogenase [Nitrospiraceae bacterium]
MNSKVSVIGAGNVGATIAQLLASENISDVVLFDILEGMPQGKALDIAEACPVWKSSASVVGTNDFADTAGSDVLVLTAGFPRKPGMSRDDLLLANADVIRTVVKGTSGLSPDSVLIIVTNPMDAMAHMALDESGFASQKVLGMGGILDSARLRTFVSMELGISPKDIETLVLGGHGDQMVPLIRYTTVKGVPITELLDRNRINSLIERTQNGGAEIVSFLKTGSAYYAPAASTVEMIRAVLYDEKRLLPCSALLDGPYGISGLFIGVPVYLGKNGVEKIVELQLTEGERELLEKSAASVKDLLSVLKK